jgi:hypothetical protein
MKPVEKGLGRSEGVVESEGIVRFKIALGKSEESEVTVSSQESMHSPCRSTRKMQSPLSSPMSPTAVTTPQ